MTIFSGAGVLIFDPRRSAFLLVFDYTKTYNCQGGFLKYYSHVENYLEKTASEELAEETRLLIQCSPLELRQCLFVDVPMKFHTFRCYFLRFECPNDICEQFNRIDPTRLPLDDDFHETNEFKYFPVEQFFNEKTMSKINENSLALDEFGKEQTLHRRVIRVIETIVKENVRRSCCSFIDVQFKTNDNTTKEKDEKERDIEELMEQTLDKTDNFRLMLNENIS